MSANYFDQLEAELRAAVPRATQAQPGARPPSRGWHRWSRSASTVLVAGVVIVVVAAVAAVFLSVHGPGAGSHPAGQTSTPGSAPPIQTSPDERLRERYLRELSHYPTYHAPRALLADFFVFSINSRSGVRIRSGLIISRPRLSSLPLGALGMITHEYPETFMRGCHPTRLCRQRLHQQPFTQPDLSQIRQVRSPAGLAFLVVPGRQGLCFIAEREGGGASGSCANLKAAEKGGEGESSGQTSRTATTGTYYILLPKSHPTTKILAGPHRWRTIRPLDGVYIGPGYPEG